MDIRDVHGLKLYGNQTEIDRKGKKICFYFYKLFKNVSFFVHMHLKVFKKC
jgi:hypothetical protein